MFLCVSSLFLQQGSYFEFCTELVLHMQKLRYWAITISAKKQYVLSGSGTSHLWTFLFLPSRSSFNEGMTLVVILRVPKVRLLPEAAPIFCSSLSRHIKKHPLLHRLMQPLWFFAMIKLGKIDVLDLRESVWVNVQARLLGKRKKKAEWRQVDCGRCSPLLPQLGLDSSGKSNFDLGLLWTLNFTHTLMSIGLCVRLN